MHIFGPTEKKVVMVVDRSGMHRARKLASTLEPSKDTFALHFLPAHSGTISIRLKDSGGG